LPKHFGQHNKDIYGFQPLQLVISYKLQPAIEKRDKWHPGKGYAGMQDKQAKNGTSL